MNFLHSSAIVGALRLGLGATRIATPANLGQPVLRHDAGLFDGQLAEQTQSGLAAFACVRAVLEHERGGPPV